MGNDGVGLILDRSGQPATGEVSIQFTGIERPRHSPFGGDPRIYAFFEAIEFLGVLGLKVWTLAHRCGRAAPNSLCKESYLKPGLSGYLRRDALVAIGRPPRAGESLAGIFLGKIFRAEVAIVSRDSRGRDLPDATRYTRCLRLLEVMAGSRGQSIHGDPPALRSLTGSMPNTGATTDTKGANR